MKVLTVWQPWASLIAIGGKPYEFRGRRPPPSYVGQRIAINAGARGLKAAEVRLLLIRLRSPQEAWRTALVPELAIPLLERCLDEPLLLPTGAIVCTASLGEARSAVDLAAEFGGPANDSDRIQYGNFGWPLSDVEVVMPPEPHRGQQGWSEWWPQ